MEKYVDISHKYTHSWENVYMENTYLPKQFGQMVGRSVKTLQKWDREGTLKAHRSPTNRRYYTHDQYLAYRRLTADSAGKTAVYARVSSAS